MNKRLHIILIAPFFPPESLGGAGSHAFYLASSLSKIPGLRIDVIAPGDQLPGGDFQWLSRKRVQVHRVRFAYEPGKALLSEVITKSLSVYKNISSEPGFSSNCVSIINAQHFAGIYVGLHLKHIYGIPVVGTIHKTPIGNSLDLSVGYSDSTYAHMKYLSSLSVDAYIAGSKFFQNELLKFSFQKKIALIYHGVPADWLRSKADIIGKSWTQEYLGLDQNSEYVLCAMRWESRKNPIDFVHAASRVINALPQRNIKFVMTAVPPKDKRIEFARIIQSLALTRHVITKKIPFEYMPAVIRYSSLCVMLTKREGLGLSVLEAMALQKPVVATDAEGVNEIVENDINGLLYADGEVDHLSSKMIEILSDGKKKWGYVNQAKKMVGEKFSSKQMALKHEQLYREICNTMFKKE